MIYSAAGQIESLQDHIRRNQTEHDLNRLRQQQILKADLFNSSFIAAV
jgi:hypothetical protein